MTDTEQLYNTVAPLRNVHALTSLIDRIETRTHGLPGMATFYGPSGFGKTTAATYATIKFQAVQVEVKSCWTAKTLCMAILHEMGAPRVNKTIAEMLDQICQGLAVSGVPLIVDEADHLVRRKAVEILRDIYEGSGSPVILIGEELLPQKLMEWERIHGRMLDWVAAEPGDISDVGHLAKIYAKGVEIHRDLQEKLLKASSQSLRRVCVNLSQIREFAQVEGLERVGVADWGERPFFRGEAPAPRRRL